MNTEQPSTMNNISNTLSSTYNNAAESVSNAYNTTSQSVSDTYNKTAESLSGPYQSTSNSFSSIKDSVSGVLSGFSTEGASQASSEFLQSNSLIARFSFLLLVIIFFVIFLRLGIYLVGYFLQPSNNPYLVYGLIPGTNSVHVTQDPKDSKSVQILRSNNQTTGIEFTWSVWLYISDITNLGTSTVYSHIFNKGNNAFGSNGIATVNNAPGLYLSNSTDPTLHIVMDTVSSSSIATTETMNITHIPLNKWFHVAIRMQNKVMDVYVNGVISGRHTFTTVPKQNYQDVYVCNNGGFSGNLSNLRYYSRALNIFDINTIVYGGPNTNASSVATTKQSTLSDYYYLSSSWYTSKM